MLVAGLPLLSACGDEHTTSTGNELHPFPVSISHYDREHISVDMARSIDELAGVPDRIALLAQYLQNPDRVDV